LATANARRVSNAIDITVIDAYIWRLETKINPTGEVAQQRW